jgi:uncharacterized membrane protein
MSGWLRYLTLKAQVSTGLNTQIAIWAIIAVIAAVVTLTFLLVAAFIWLSDLYDGVIAGLVLAAVFAVIAAVAAVVCVMIRRHTIESARLELAERSNAAPLLDPKLLGMGYQIGQTIGWRKLISLAAVGLLAAGLAREWVGRDRSQADDEHDPQG